MDTPLPEQLRDDLRGLIKGSLHIDDLNRTLYSTDASIFQVQPLGVVIPQDEADIQALVRYAGEHQISLIPRGAGTGLSGESLGSGLVVDLSRNFRRILEIGCDTVRVQPGVVLRELNRELAKVGKRFAPDPAQPECTIGGMLATNASGSRSLLHGYTRHHVEQLRLVLDSGDSVSVGTKTPIQPLQVDETGREEDGGTSRLNDITASLNTLLLEHKSLIQLNQTQTRFNRFGYCLHDILNGDQVDLPGLLVGSEGTLAIFTEALLRTLPIAEGRAVALLGFNNLDSALRCARLALPSGPAACELVDRRLLRLARGNNSPVTAQIPAATESVLLVEYEADTPRAARLAATDLVNRFSRLEPLANLALMASTPKEIDEFWQIREVALPSLYSLRGNEQPLAFIEDIGVPVDALPNYLLRVQELLQQHETTASYLIHAGTGQVHMRPFMNLQRPNEDARMWSLAEDVYKIVLELGGTISTQHGTGLARTPWITHQFGSLATVFREVKTLFDPRNIFNPGKIVGINPSSRTWPLRKMIKDPSGLPTGSPEESELVDPDAKPSLIWSGEELRTEVLSCNGCGQCRTESISQRMCPIFRINQDEAATPRAKANLMRFIQGNIQDPRLIASDSIKDVADLCVNCKMCRSGCPAHVNIPKLMIEAKAANVAQHGLGRLEWVVARTELFARLGSAFAPIANAFLGSPIARWFLEQLLGVSRYRRLPLFASQNFLRLARQKGWTKKPVSGSQTKVAYFIDIYANYIDPTIAEAVVGVLRHQGIEVYVPPDQRGCGMAPLADGDVETAREILQHNIRILAELVREGYTILCSEPTAALMFRQDALDLLDETDARLVADHTVEFTAFLLNLHEQGLLKTDFQPLKLPIGHHIPCHIKALNQTPAGPQLLSLIPGIRLHPIDVGCSGMAGTFGLRAKNYQASREAGKVMLEELGRPGVLFGSTECSSCRLQMEDGTGKRTLHPAQYLALAYGLMPDLWQRFQQPIGRRVLR